VAAQCGCRLLALFATRPLRGRRIHRRERFEWE